MPNSDNMDLEKGGVKHDQGKLRMDLVPPDVTVAMAAVLGYGAEKYEAWNFAKGMRQGRLLASAQRHLEEMKAGVAYDEESGFPHSWMLLTNMAMYIHCQNAGKLEHDVQPQAEGAMRTAMGVYNAVRAKSAETNS